MPGDEAGLGAAQEGAGLSELFGVAEAAGRIELCALGQKLINRDAALVGIQPEAMEKIFERFYTDRPHQGFGQNSGLGLSISRQIVEAHGGHIRAENRMGAAAGPDGPAVLGARFVVRLPAI